MMAVGVMVMAGLVLSARTIDEALSESKLPQLAEFSSYVTVFNELEEMDAAADQAWLDLSDRAAYDRHRRALHARMIEAMGGLPEKTPLNARTMSVVRKQGYRVEKVIFESMPGLCVTANLFVPDGVTAERPAPAVVMSCGHGEDGKDDPVYLRACVLAVQAGFVALMFDPYEQGERRRFKGLNCCQHHNQIGARASLLGWSMALLRLWDGIRAVDYVGTRPEVDRNRIGYMGQSGGGTMTSLMTAADWRLKATAPSCYLTTLTSLCEHMGPQDAEQNIFGQLTFGLNHTGYVLLPDTKVAITSKFSDMFTYYGTKRLFRIVEKVADRVGASDHYALNAAPGPHGWTETTERASVDWMRAWLKDEKGLLPPDLTAYRKYDLGFDIERDADVGLSENERGCVKTHRTADVPGSRSIFEIFRERLAAFERIRTLPPPGSDRADLVRRLARIRTADESKVTVHEIASEAVGDKTVTHLAFLYSTGLSVPAELVVKTGTQPKEIVLTVGRNGRAAAFGTVADRLTDETAVLSADLTGLGAIGKGRFPFYGADIRPEEGTSVMLFLMGESMIGRRATDLLAMAAWLRGRGFGSVTLRAEADTAIAAAHAVAASPGTFAGVEVAEAPMSWKQTLAAENDGKAVVWFTDIVNGALAHYDWPDLLK